MFFEYGEKELSYLRKKDKRLCEVIDRIGHIDRTVDTGLFSSVVHHIIGQQITAKAQETVWQRMRDTIWRSGAGCAWYIITGKSTGGSLKGTEGGSARIAARQACISGLWQAAQFRK